MTQIEKELLMQDISCRIPYGVIVNVSGISNVKLTSLSWYGEVGVDDGSTNLYPISEIKPYLFPLSNMTDEQKNEYHELIGGMFETNVLINFEVLEELFYKNHFDYRGLISKGLAIDCTNLDIY